MGFKQSGADTFVMNQYALLMKSLRIVCTGIILLSTIFIYAQSEIELRTDGIVVPRTTSAAVVSPVKGMLIYDTDIDGFKYYDGTDWLNIGGGTGGSVAWSDITGKPAGFADGTDHVNDADANASNELQTVSKSGSTVTLSDGGGNFSINDADADATNELQTISKSGSTVILSDGGGSFSVNDADANATNEIQNLSLTKGSIQLSNSTTSIPISDISPWTISGV